MTHIICTVDEKEKFKMNLFVRVMEHMIWLVRFAYALLLLSCYYAVKLMIDCIKHFIIYKVMKYRKILIKYNAHLKRSCISQS